MTGKYQAYPEYKNSGIQWLDETPVHWSTSKLRYMFSFGKGLTITKENLLDEGVPCVNYGEVHSKYGFEVDPAIHPLKYVSEDYLKSSSSALLSKGDLVFADTSEDIDGSGNFTQLTSDQAVFAGYHTIIARPIDGKNSRFYAYLFDSKEFRTQIRTAVKGVKVFSITQAILCGVNVWLPTIEERNHIANFLDHETAKIDTLIEKQQQLIKLLKEKRQAVISHAVTKGLNPNAPMRDSEVEWLGEVPEGWSSPKIKWFFHTESGGTPNTSKQEEYYQDGEIPWIRTTDLNNNDLFETPVAITDQAVKDSACSLLPENAVLIAMYGGAGSIGKHSLLKFKSTINQAVCAILPNEKIDSDFLHMYVEFYRPYWMVGAEGTRKDPNINQDVIRELVVPCPPVEEQTKIVFVTKNKLSAIDEIIQKSKLNIALMQERRTALISAAVTGKIDVRNWQAPQQKQNKREAAA